MAASVTIIDSGGANIASLRFALERLGARTHLTHDANEIGTAERLILPGVGAAQDAMQRLQQRGLDRLLPQLQQPLLGICLGMQLLFTESAEDQATCLGMIPGQVKRIDAAPDRPVPHMGWNQITPVTTTALLADIAPGSHFYFVHSYAVAPGPATVAVADYGGLFTAMVVSGNVAGTQFHPERSGQNGAQLLRNFLNWHP